MGGPGNPRGISSRDASGPRDVFLLNDPYHGNNHLPDLTVFVPVFDGGRLVFWSINARTRATSAAPPMAAYNAGATEIWQEGIRITPLRSTTPGSPRDDVLRMLATNVRHPRDFRGDLAAMIGSARVGERRLLSAPGRVRRSTLHGQRWRRCCDGAEDEARACIATWKDGIYRGEAVLDDDGHGFARRVHPRDGHQAWQRPAVDLTDSHAQVTGFINSSYANMRSAVAMALAYLIDPRDAEERRDVPTAGGDREAGQRGLGRCPPAPVTLCTNHCAQEIAEAVIKALAGACPERAMAGWCAALSYRHPGHDPRTGRPFIWHMFHARGGGGASSAGDGWPTAGEGQAAGGIKFGSVEVAEVRFPLFFRRHEFRPGSGGDGPLPRRRRVGARAGDGDRPAGPREHRGRRRSPCALRAAGR